MYASGGFDASTGEVKVAPAQGAVPAQVEATVKTANSKMTFRLVKRYPQAIEQCLWRFQVQLFCLSVNRDLNRIAF